MPDPGGQPRWKVIALFGVAGVGKTTMAREIFERLQPAHSEKQVFITCDSQCTEPVTLDLITRKILVALDIQEAELAQASEGICLELLKASLARPGNLIVVDGLQVGLPRHVLDELLDRVGTTDSTFIVVSRAKPLGYDERQLWEITPFSAEQSMALLQSRLGDQSADEHPWEFAEIARWCAGLPRAIDAVCGVIASRRGDLPSIARALAEPAECLTVLRTQEHDLGAELAAPYDRLTDAARKALAAISLLWSPTVDSAAISLITGEAEPYTTRLLEGLEDVRLLDVEHRSGPLPVRFRLNRLTRLALTELNGEACQEFKLSRERLDAHYRAQIDHFYDRWSHEETSETTMSRQTVELLKFDYRDVLYACTDAPPDEGRPCWKLAHIIAGLFPLVSCDWSLWEDFFDKARHTAEPIRMQNGVEQAIHAAEQALGLRQLFAGRLDRAEPLLTASIRNAKGRLTPDDDMLIRGHVHLAELHMERGRYEDARRQITEQSVRTDPRPYDEDKPWATFVSAIVDRNIEPGLWHRVDQLQSARGRLNDILDPTRHSRTSLYIADVLRETGQGADAEKEYQKAREVAEAHEDRFACARADYSRAMLFLDWQGVSEARRLVNLIRPAYRDSEDELWHRRLEYLDIRLDHLDPEVSDRRTVADRADRLLREIDPGRDAWLYNHAVLLQAQTLLALEEFPAARNSLDKIQIRLNQPQYAWISAQAHVVRGRSFRHERQNRQARVELKAARRIFAQCHDLHGEARARRELIWAWRHLGVLHPQRIVARRLDQRNAKLKPLSCPDYRPYTRSDVL